MLQKALCSFFQGMLQTALFRDKKCKKMIFYFKNT